MFLSYFGSYIELAVLLLLLSVERELRAVSCMLLRVGVLACWCVLARYAPE
jgi:hypothetical protein